jgi:hypothetical protein
VALAEVLQQLLARGSNHGTWGSLSPSCSADPSLMRPHGDSETIRGDTWISLCLMEALSRHEIGVVVKALYCKPGGCGFDYPNSSCHTRDWGLLSV